MNKLTNAIKKLLKRYLAEDFAEAAASRFDIKEDEFKAFVEEWIDSQGGSKKASKKGSRKLNGYQFFLRSHKGKGMTREELVKQWKREDKTTWAEKAKDAQSDSEPEPVQVSEPEPETEAQDSASESESETEEEPEVKTVPKKGSRKTSGYQLFLKSLKGKKMTRAQQMAAWKCENKTKWTEMAKNMA
jgi:predicted GIY-YIG superfamily endonuclease